jgi:hypothetical protein
MRLALAFQRSDVDAFLGELDHDQYSEWCAFLQLEPHGWAAQQIVATRLSYMLAQTHSSRKLKERDYAIRLAGQDVGKHSRKAEAARFEAMSVRTEIEAAARAKQ